MEICVHEVAYDLILKVIDTICDTVEELYHQLKEKISELKDSAIKIINRACDWWNSNFNNGYKYASANPQIVLDTYKLRNYAQRLQSVNSRVSKLDGRLDALYWKVGLFDLWNLIQADLLIGYNYRIARCVSYLNDTASDFENAESAIQKTL